MNFAFICFEAIFCVITLLISIPILIVADRIAVRRHAPRWVTSYASPLLVPMVVTMLLFLALLLYASSSPPLPDLRLA